MLEELGYRPLIEPEKIVSEAMKKSLATLGDSFSKTLLQHLSSTYDLAEDQVLGEISLIEKELREILHGGANVILERVKEEIYNYIRSKNKSESVNRYLIHLARKTEKFEDINANMISSATVESASGAATSAIDAHAWKMMLNEVITEVLAVEAFEFIRQVKSGDHLVLIYRREITKESLISEFLTKSNDGNVDFAGLISIRPTRLQVKNKLCQELVSNGSDIATKITDWVISIKDSADFRDQAATPDGTRIAAENTWFFENDPNDTEALEKSLNYFANADHQSAVLCTFDASKMNAEKVKSFLEHHKYVILDDPLMIYRKPQS